MNSISRRVKQQTVPLIQIRNDKINLLILGLTTSQLRASYLDSLVEIATEARLIVSREVASIHRHQSGNP